MPYNYFQQKAIYDQMNGTAESDRRRADMAKRDSEKSEPPKSRPRDPNQLAKIIVGEATEVPAVPKTGPSGAGARKKKRPAKG